MEILSAREQVKQALKKHSNLRDNDRLLCAYIWKKQLNGASFIDAYKSGQLSNAESIRRSRQDLQKHHKSLRGEAYKIRQKRTSKVKSDLGYVNKSRTK